MQERLSARLGLTVRPPEPPRADVSCSIWNGPLSNMSQPNWITAKVIGTDGSGLTPSHPDFPGKTFKLAKESRLQAGFMLYIRSSCRGRLGLQKQKVCFNQLPCPLLSS